jgi:hypothetical protein
MAVGTYSIADLLQTRFVTAKQFGVETIAQVLRADMAAHNERVALQMRELCEVGQDAYRVAGGSGSAVMTEVDEFGHAPTQKSISGEGIGFPLRRYQVNVGWTEAFIENATPADVAQKQLDAEIAHLRQINTQVRRSIFRSLNYNFTDLNVDNVVLACRRFVNADGLAAIPDGPDGTVFNNAAHTHFTAAAALAVADITTMINTVIEHGHGGNVKLCIAQADEAAFRALVGFTAYPDPRITTILTQLQSGKVLDQSRLNDRAIGTLGGAEVWVKSWVPANYSCVYDSADPRKPLYFRTRKGSDYNTLRSVSNWSSHPFGGEDMEAMFGVSTWTRTNGACHFHAGAAWADAL